MREAIVVGAGIGGLATAKALADAGWRVTVLEEDAALRESGAGVVLTPNGLAALDALGLGDAVRDAAVTALPLGMRTAQGSPLQHAAEFASSAMTGIHRTTLHRILVGAADAAEIVTGAQAVSVQPGVEPTVTVVEGGEEHERTADLVVGADGIDSLVRPAIRDVPVDYSGATCWRGVVARLDSTPEAPLQWFGAGIEVGLVPIDGDHAYWFVAARARMGGASADEHAAAMDAVRGFEQIVRDHVAADCESPVLRHDLRYLPTGLRTFVAPGVALLGDAAHAMLPTLAQGASAALEDAATLGALAAGSSSIDDVLAEYDRLRRPRTQRLQRLAHRIYRSGLHVRHPLLVAARNGALDLMPAIGAEIAADWVLHWSAPER